MKILKIGIVGSRKRDTQKDKDLIRQAVKHLIDKDKNVTIHIVSGGAKQGADKFAEELSEELKLGISLHLPDKSKMKDNSRYEYIKQLFDRNSLIAEECDMLICTWDGDSSGTQDTITKVKLLGKPIVML